MAIDFKKMLEESKFEDQCKYKVIIAGGRDMTNYQWASKQISHVLEKLPKDKTMIVEGGAKGADACGRQWAIDNDYHYTTFPAYWDLHGKAAGHIRNAEMADYSTHLIAFWEGKSRGTKGMIELAKKNGLKVVVIKY